MQNKGMNLMLSNDAKPRLKWTPELHQRFVDAVNQLGGSEKATPKSVMRVMGIQGITLYHLKSHLQKYRLGKSQHSEIYDKTNEEEEEERESQRNQLIGEEFQRKKNEDSHIDEALQVQMDVQRKLYEQIEVQRHLQLRIEAQGKYLQTVLHKAQETLSEYRVSDHGVVSLKKQQLSKLVSMVNINASASSLSGLTDIQQGTSNLERPSRTSNGSLESSLTSSETDERKKKKKKNSIELSLMEMQPSEENNGGSKRKRIIRNANKFDLNSDTNIVLDLNCKGIEQ